MSSEILKSRTKTSTNVRTTTEVDSNNKPPQGAIIIEQNIRTDTEQIENGWLITKCWDGRYRVKKDGDSTWFNYTKKWFSKTNPLSVKLNDTSLAEAFDDTK